MTYGLEDYQYELPAELIAQTPAEARDRARLMVVDRASGDIQHRGIVDLLHLLRPGDLLVVNDTQVVPARLLGRKESGGKVEVLVLHPTTETTPYRCLLKASKPATPGTRIFFREGVRATVVENLHQGLVLLDFEDHRQMLEILTVAGSVPLPPYIRRNGNQQSRFADRLAYQTVYARNPGAVAAPTAGLHFTEGLLEQLRQHGIRLAFLTLHVGYGTFQPVRERDIRKHRLHKEYFDIQPHLVEDIRRAKDAGKRVVAVGTSTVRALEFCARSGQLEPGKGWCDLFIYPGYQFKVIDALLTNFHLPGSSLLMLVSALAGRELILTAYAEAIRCGYRFYSYGDAMLIG
ncbi:MAG: tRNA preQ1(34) S-adenosylmethionine ribosyltransferase-isomerase QueA [Deltaproteobacteria bacterium]|nr:tRNA preQ1(34) S-adenosylmethionine ribosyltransferase-isomerase QueA [Deltaproteobacteria bacterium]MBW2071986.1 tRNA preQ1(34) S-adenosylmethionine ribosyltransferase-isomerase QueA [Deltaproteobacteria bacterium]